MQDSETETEHSREEAERILTRAASLDGAARGSLSNSELRRAASEAGILPQAIEAALAEAAREKKKIGPDRHWVGRVVMILIGALAGIVPALIARAGNINGFETSVSELNVLLIISVGSSVVRRHVDSHAEMQIRNALLWSTFAAGWGVGLISLYDEVISNSIGFGLISAVAIFAVMGVPRMIQKFRTRNLDE